MPKWENYTGLKIWKWYGSLIPQCILIDLINVCISVIFQFLQYFIPKNAFASGIARASRGFEFAIEVLQVFDLKISKNLQQSFKYSLKVLFILQVTVQFKCMSRHHHVASCNISNMDTVFNRDIQTPRRELKIRCTAEYFW